MEKIFKWSYLFYLEYKIRFAIVRGAEALHCQYLINKQSFMKNEHSQSIPKTINA